MYLFATGHCTCHKQVLMIVTNHELQLYNFFGRIMAVNNVTNQGSWHRQFAYKCKMLCLPQVTVPVTNKCL